jgi:Carboxypeptidase regulatory-like domain
VPQLRSLSPAENAVSVLALAMLAALTACARHTAFEDAPLAPRLTFLEQVPPQTIVVLVTDAHSGAPVEGAVVSVPPTAHHAASDTGGRVRLSNVPPGAHTVLVRRIGYDRHVATVSVSETQGVAMLVQLRRRKVIMERAVVGGGDQER